MNNTHKLSGSYDGYQSCGVMPRVPGNVSHLGPEANHPLAQGEIEFFWRADVQHGKIRNYQPPVYYQDYLMSTSCSPAMQCLQASQANKLRQFFKSNHTNLSLIEIGCGDGSFLKHAAGHFSHVVGIEPSKRFAAEAIEQGFEVVNAYVTSSKLVIDEKFDAFVSRQVFEHLPDPLDVLIGIKQMLRPDAVGMIEVPNGQRALRLGRFFEFFPDHVHYYSINSLVALASEAGFTVIECREAFGQDYLELWMRNDSLAADAFHNMVQRREKICREITSLITNASDEHKRLAIWGAGAKTLSIATMLSRETLARICYVIDSDPHKHGLFLPNSPCTIMPPSEAVRKPPAIIINFALTYGDEIYRTIQNTFDRLPDVYTLTEDGEICLIT